MNKKFNKNLFISILFFLTFVGVVVANEMNFFKAFTTVEVVVAKENLPKDTTVTSEHITKMRVPREHLTDQMIRHENDVLGQTVTENYLSSQFIFKNSLDVSMLRPTPEHEFFPIPNEWFVEIQGTLRRYDMINISAVYAGKVIDEENAATSPEINPATQRKIRQGYVLEEVPVAYVKGGKNAEVTNLTADDKRLYGSQNPSSIELSLTLEEFKSLEALFLNGYKFIISY